MGGMQDKSEYAFIERISQEYKVPFRVEMLGEGVRGYKVDSEIVLNGMNPPERRNWTFCHELGHIILEHSSKPSDSEEREADEFAAEIILPERDFVPDSSGLELTQLKELYPHASHEVIVRRGLKYNQAIVTIIDNGIITRRMASDGLVFPLNLSPGEKQILQQCQETKSEVSFTFDNLELSAYYIDEGKSVIRIIIVVKPFDTF